MTTTGIDIDEREIRGKWIIDGRKIQADENCKRIELLITSYLHFIGCDSSGWDRLYLSPDDGRYWELTYPESELHGGGPPCLVCLPIEEAQTKYGHTLKIQGNE